MGMHRQGASAWEHPADLSHCWAHESLFGRLSRMGLRHPGTEELFERELRGCSRHANPLTVFTAGDKGSRPESIERMRQFVGVAGRGGLDRLVGADLIMWREGESRVLLHALRYCPECMQRGYHSMLFQHRIVARCPGHGIPLREVCPHCREPIVPNLRNALLRPFECGKCSGLLVKTVLPAGSHDEQRMVDDLIGDWRRDLAVERGWSESRRALPGGGYFLEPLHRSQRIRHLQRICAWPQYPTSRWIQFKQMERVVEDAAPRPARHDLSPYAKAFAVEAAGVLAWLARQCGAHGCEQSQALVQSAWIRPQNILPDEDRGFAAIPVALHMTMVQYGTPLIDQSRTPSQAFRAYQGIGWNGFSAQVFPLEAGPHASMLLKQEILGFFALCLLRCADRKANLAYHLSGGQLPPASFCSAWKLQREGRRLHLRVRPRADRRLVVRLLERYADTRLQRPVQCTELSASPHGPSFTFTRWSPVFPLELLHFPRGIACVAEAGEVTEKP